MNARFATLRRIGAPATIGGLLSLGQSANAAAIDVAAVVTDIGAQVASIVLVGGAVLLVYAAVKAFKWVRSAMS